MMWRAVCLSLCSLLVVAGCPAGPDVAEPAPPLVSCADPVVPAATFSSLALVVPAALSLPPGFLDRLRGLVATVTADDAAFATVSAVGDDPDTLYLVLSEQADAAPAHGFVHAQTGENVVEVRAVRPFDLMYGAYAFLEKLGLRYSHPLEVQFVHATDRSVLHIPDDVDETRESPFAERGLHLHLLHPTEYYTAWFEPSPQNLEVAHRVIDWAVMTGTNLIQHYHLALADWDTLRPHLDAIIDYAHAHGVRVGFVGQLYDDGQGLQQQYAFVRDADEWEAELTASLDEVTASDFDVVEFAFGEFFAVDVYRLREMLNFAVDRLDPLGVQVGAQNHIGNYEDLYTEIDGEPIYFYHVPGTADERLVQTVHTVSFYDLYRDWAMYEHESFAMQRDYILQELPERPVKYFPESAYWVSADIDVPIFFSEFIRSRHNDISGLYRDITAAGLPALDGHVLYSSGHEWNYWMIDYLTARMLFFPEAQLSTFVDHIATSYPGCEDEYAELFTEYMDLSTDYLFDQRLTGYVLGEDAHDDIGYVAGYETHPHPVPFGVLRNDYDQAARDAYRTDVVDALAHAVDDFTPLRQRVRALCEAAPPSSQTACLEFRDAVDVLTLRLRFAALLYGGVLDVIEGQDTGDAKILEAEALLDEVQDVVLARSEHYRFPLDELVEPRANLTRYPFGLLRQAHNLCLWWRPLEKARIFLDKGDDPSPFEVTLTCQD